MPSCLRPFNARSIVCAYVLALTMLAVVPPLAEAAIVVQKGIAGVELGMSQDQVVALLGQPQDKRQSGEPGVDPGVQTDFIYADGLTVSFVENMSGVISVSTTNSAEKTASGVGVGSSVGALKREVDRLRCDRKRRPRECFVGRQVVGKKRTVFTMHKGKATRVAVFIQFP